MKILVTIVLVLVALVCPSIVQGATSKNLEWYDVSDSSALCNDFTRAGYFIRRKNASDKWIVFLESGGLCYSSETCNRRFFVSEVSRRFNRPPSDESQQNILRENFDPAEAWNETVVSGREAAVDVVSPYMTSMRCFENKTDYFPQGFSVQGTDILDEDCEENPLFCDYNHVVVPYCSSDLWLGTEVDETRSNTAADGECTRCFDYNQNNGCFKYNPLSESIQFTYRGKRIFMSVIRDLLAMGMDGATEVVLAGSSAGGLGALNSAKWLQSELQGVGSAELVVIFDSAWFINFRGSIYQIFDGTLSQAESAAQRQSILTLLSLLQTNEACADVQFGLPCCFSPFCLFTQANAAGERYYPEVPTFGIFSLYDSFLLASSLAELEAIPNSVEFSVGYGVDFLLTFGEYGGEMNSTVMLTESKTTFFSSYATQCLQHVYLATSTLWGLPGASVFGRAITVELERDSGSFTHLVEAGIWNTRQLAGPTIQQALIQWYDDRTVPMHFRDNCSGPHCNNQCPETFTLGELDSNDWPPVAKAMIVVLVLGVTFLCLIAKGIFCIWLWLLQRKQNIWLCCLQWKRNHYHTEKQDKTEDIAETGDISVSCLNLRYEVTVRNKNTKDQKNDTWRMQSLDDESLVGVDSDSDTEHTDSSNGIEKLTCGRWKKKKILKGISTYFKYGELTGIMGVSGSGKTTFLDLLTGRRTSGKSTGEIMINGFRMDEDVQKYFVANTGYVLQLGTPYYEELTVRDNLTLAAEMKLNGLSREEKFKRVNQVMEETMISEQGETPVGKLSGGEKRRLSVALQLLHHPKIIFLDEPTSGLDASSAHKLLMFLHALVHHSGVPGSAVRCKRAVILTIHQPRLDIFHMFDKLLLLSEGKIAYDGPSEEVCPQFATVVGEQAALGMMESPADAIMDILGNHKCRRLITRQYEGSDKKKTIEEEINTTRGEGQLSTDDGNELSHSYVKQFSRLAVLEARASKRANFWHTLYLPSIFSIYGLLLGTVYFRQTNPFLVLSGFAALTFASSLVMFPMLNLYYIRALEIFSYEFRDGICRTHDLVLQGFCRAISLVAIPVVMCATALYFLMITKESYAFAAFGQVVIVHLALNQTWTALYIFIICASPNYSVYLSSMVTSVGGFTAGFFIPIDQIPWWYRWLSYINPNYYGFSATAFLLLNNFKTGCTGSQFECYASSGEYFLEQFSVENINPYAHILALLGFTILFLLLAWFFNSVHHNYHKIWKIWQEKHNDDSSTNVPAVVTGGGPEDRRGGVLHKREGGHQESLTATVPDTTRREEEPVSASATPASSRPPLGSPGPGAARERALQSIQEVEGEDVAKAAQVEIEVANTGQEQAKAEQVETKTSTEVELESFADVTAKDAEISRFHEEMRTLQMRIQDLEAQKNNEYPKKWRRITDGNIKRSSPPSNNLHKRTAVPGAARGQVHPLQLHRAAWEGRQPGGQIFPHQLRLAASEGGTAAPGAAGGQIHPHQPWHSWRGRQPGVQIHSHQASLDRDTSNATSPENICSSEESLKRRLSIRRKIVNQRIKETQDYIYSRSGAFIESKSMQLQH